MMMRISNIWALGASALIITTIIGCTDGDQESAEPQKDYSQTSEEGYGEDHGEGDRSESLEGEYSGEEDAVRISDEQRRTAGIRVQRINLEPIFDAISLPGEIKVDAYAASVVTSRIPAIAVKRHVVLGETVEKGQELVTLFSLDVAKAQGEFIVANSEWLRVEKLGRKVVSDQRFTQAKVGAQQTRAQLLAYGLAPKSIDVLAIGDAAYEPGEFQLLSPQDGVIASDDFRGGQLVDAGATLFDVIDESVMWVEVRLSPSQAALVKKGDKGWVQAGDESREAVVFQMHRRLNEKTRTLGAHLRIDNSDLAFQPGQFVDVELTIGKEVRAFTVPNDAVLRSPDGSWVVFTENEKGELAPREITIVRVVGDNSVIDGVEPGTRVVTEGAFFVYSELAKSSFDIDDD